MHRRTTVRLAALAAMALALGACEGVRKQFGLTKQSPDEFRVVSNAPLTLPPDFSLRPPAPGEPRPQVGTAADQARRAIFRAATPQDPAPEKAMSGDGLSTGEASLLRAAGAENAETDIRKVIDRETNRINAESDSFLEALVFWRDEDKPGVVIDASGEAKRLRENAAFGKGATAGQTPTIERREKALFEGLFSF